MSAMQAMLGSPLAQAIGWALVHLVWQGIIVAGILAALLAVLQRKSAHVRYVVACAAMLVLLLLAAATAVRAYDAGSDTVTPAAAQTTAIAAAADNAAPSDAPALLERMRSVLPKIVLFWLIGVAALSFRLAGGWLRAQRLAKRSATQASDDWQRTVARIAEQIGLRRSVQLLHSAVVEVPTVLGFLRPVILLPMTLTGLSPEQIEMILAHELAHIRRHDFLVNLLQSVVETLLFYHPAVWWISSRIRIEREHCCDDAAIAVGGNALQYARALTRLEQLRADATQLALAANGGSLLGRIRRLAGLGNEGPGAPSRWLAGAALLTVVVVLSAMPMLARDQAPAPPAAPAAPKAPQAVPAPPAAPAPPAKIAQSRIEVDGDAEMDDEDGPDVEVEVDVPEPPEVPEAPEAPEIAPPAPRAPRVRAPRVVVAPRARLAPKVAICPDGVSVHVAPMAMPHVEIPAIRIDTAAIAGEARAEAGRAMTPSKEWREKMKSAGLSMTDKEASQLYIMGVGPRYVQSLREAGLRNLTAHDVLRLHERGITAEFLRELRRMQQ